MLKNNFKYFYRFLPLLVLIGPINPGFGLDGFPFNNKIEVLLFIISLFCIFSKNKETNKRAIYLISFLFLISTSLSVINSQNSFDACYTTSQTPTSNFEMSFNIKDNCQFSYEVPFNKQITRNDYLLDFNNKPVNAQGIEFTNWNLYFFNQTGFNFYDKAFYGGSNDLDIKMHWINNNKGFERVSYNYLEQNGSANLFDYGFTNIVQPIEPSRNWLSFGVNWKSKSSIDKQNILVSYVGEVKIKSNGELINLPNSYSEVNTVEIKLAENSSLDIDYFYRYNAGINSYPNIPYASFSLTDLNNESLNPLKTTAESILEIVNVVIVLMLFINALIHLEIGKNNLVFNLSILIAIVLIYEKIPNSLTDYIEILFIALIAYLIFNKNIYTITSFMGISLAVSLLSIKNLNVFSNVLYSVGGSDPLKYESWSQQIIHFRSLQGGENIFLYQPGYRYLLSLLRLFFGDSHVAISLIGRFIFVILLLLLFINLAKMVESKKVFLSLNLIVLYIFFSTYSSKLNLYSSLSEWPTWLIGLGLAVYIFKENLLLRDTIYISILIGLCFLVRENQLPGLLILSFIFFIKNKKQKKNIFTNTLIVGTLFLLPFIHNFIYGNKFVLNQDVFTSGYYYLSPKDLLFNFPEVKEQLIFQINFLISNPLNEGVVIMAGKILPLVVLFIIFQWSLMVIRSIFSNSENNFYRFLYIILPLSFLGPHLFYQVHTYFPRHIIQGYLFMVISTLYLYTIEKENSVL